MDKRLHLSAKNKTDLLPNERVLHAASAGGMDSISQGARITVGIVNRIAPQNAMCKRWDTPYLATAPVIRQRPSRKRKTCTPSAKIFAQFIAVCRRSIML